MSAYIEIAIFHFLSDTQYMQDAVKHITALIQQSDMTECQDNRHDTMASHHCELSLSCVD